MSRNVADTHASKGSNGNTDTTGAFLTGVKLFSTAPWGQDTAECRRLGGRRQLSAERTGQAPGDGRASALCVQVLT